MANAGAKRLLRSEQHEARAAVRQRRSSNANSLSGQNSARSPQICAPFQRDNLRRHFWVRVSHTQPRSRSRISRR